MYALLAGCSNLGAILAGNFGAAFMRSYQLRGSETIVQISLRFFKNTSRKLSVSWSEKTVCSIVATAFKRPLRKWNADFFLQILQWPAHRRAQVELTRGIFLDARRSSQHTRWALGCCSNNQIRIFQTARSRLYRGRFLQPNTHFLSIFRDLQDRHTFAPLLIQKLQIFCENLQKICNFFRCLQNVAEIV